MFKKNSDKEMCSFDTLYMEKYAFNYPTYQNT